MLLFIIIIFFIIILIKRNNYEKFKNLKNLCIIFTYLPKNQESNLRKNVLINNLKKIKLPYILNEGRFELKYKNPMKNKNYMSNLNIIDCLEKFKNSSYKYAIITEDDFGLIENFKNKLYKIINQLPKNWSVLHLCPGLFWGNLNYRKTKDKKRIGVYNPVIDMSSINYTNDYFFSNINKKKWEDKKLWLGGPTAFLIQKNNLNNFTKKYKECFKKFPNLSCDMILVKIINSKHYVCRDPQLCFENELNGSVFDRIL